MSIVTNKIYKEKIDEKTEEIFKPNMGLVDTKTVDSTSNVINKLETESNNLSSI